MELCDRRQVQEVYTIRQVAEMTGVPDNTIRSWERRFGIPRPDRSGSNQRRYRQRDIAAIRSIQAARERGRTMEQAIQEVRAADSTNIEEERAAEVHAVPGSALPTPTVPDDPGIDRLTDALAAFDVAGADRLLSDAVWAISIEGACFALLLPAADAIAEEAAAGQLSPVGARFATGWIHGKLLTALDQSSPGTGTRHLVVSAMHDDSALHDGLASAIVLARAGYRVTWLGAGTRATEIEEAVDRLRVEAVVLAARSSLSIVAAASAGQRLARQRAGGAWHGVVAVTGVAKNVVHDAVVLPSDARRTVSTLESAMRTRESALRLVRNP